jgi:hypothetical protein
MILLVINMVVLLILHDFNGLIPNIHDSNDLIMFFWIQVFF